MKRNETHMGKVPARARWCHSVSARAAAEADREAASAAGGKPAKTGPGEQATEAAEGQAVEPASRRASRATTLDGVDRRLQIDRIDARHRAHLHDLRGGHVELSDQFLDIDIERVRAGDDETVRRFVHADREEDTAWLAVAVDRAGVAIDAERAEAEQLETGRVVHGFAIHVAQDVIHVNRRRVAQLERRLSLDEALGLLVEHLAHEPADRQEVAR